MPLYKSIAVNETTHILIWKITESESELKSNLALSSYSVNRLQKMKLAAHRSGYLAIRQLLHLAQYTDADITYTSNGKPILSDGVEISITHSFPYAAIILGEQAVGIDIEQVKTKVEAVVPKFISAKEAEYLDLDNNNVNRKLEMLTSIWCAKEAIYKQYNTPGLSFKNHIDIAPFENDAPYTKGVVTYQSDIQHFHVDKIKWEGFICIYTTHI